ncbi:hypothetical protein MLD38_014608 [Melastoma candidum]|uniref:Uncharacterized protein n=1 Tax=Melastoma candidum TaxID=119954 RepID=A0ACB9RF76_9MYRT|nr:hypothetical protein MLD38_014608 [Melastoma candidum]
MGDMLKLHQYQVLLSMRKCVFRASSAISRSSRSGLFCLIFCINTCCSSVKLADWENKRENAHHMLLTEEAEMKQHGCLWDNVNRQGNKLFYRWMSRKRPENLEPAVGKWVSYLNPERELDSVVGRCPTPCAPRSVYLYDNVGSGKTMLMDMFHNLLWAL